MGYKWEVRAWKEDEYGNWNYRYVYEGSSAIMMLYYAWKAKKTTKCLKIEWR